MPIPWSGSEPPYGFSTGTPWLPQPAEWRDFTAEAEAGRTGSMLEFYRAVLALRHQVLAGADETVVWQPAPDDVLSFTRGPGFGCVVNLSDQPYALPRPPLLVSDELVDGLLPPNAAAWVG